MPSIQLGSLVLIGRQVTKIDDRGIYLAEYPGLGEVGSLAIKRQTLDKSKRLVVAESDNPAPQHAPASPGSAG